MSHEQKSTPVKQRLKRVVRAIHLPKKNAHRKSGPPEWLGVGVSRDGKKRVYYLRLRFPRPLLLAVLRWRKFSIQHRFWSRVIAIGLVLLLLASIFAEAYTPKKQQILYDISGPVGNLIGDPVPQYESKLKTDPKTGTIKFNSDYAPQADTAGISSAPKITAQFAGGTSNAVTVDDPVNKVSVTLTPKFAVASPQKNINRVVYPLIGRNASAIYSLKGIGVKEDFVLRSVSDDTMSFDYDLSLSDGLEARLDKDGSLGIYGSSAPLYGNITTSTDSDAKLLQKARQNAKKDKLIFKIPAPYIKEANKHKSTAKAWFSLKGKKMTVSASNLKAAAYPLSIDPSIYVETAAKLMRGNNETNIDFDASNELIQKSQTTGARIDAWSSTNNLNAPIWQQGTAVAGGYIYSAGGIEGASVTTVTYYTAGTFASGTGGFTVPAGITSLTIKTWGAGGGGGVGSGSSGVGGAGGGGGYTKSVVTVTAGDNLTINVGSGGAKAAGANPGTSNGGNGGGYSAVTNATTATLLLKAGGGGGGGGTRGTANGGAGGAGGGSSGVAGSTGAGTSPQGGGGGAGTSAAAGAAGSAGTGGVAGSIGGAANAANSGGNGAGFASSTCNTAVTNTQGGAGVFGGGGGGGKDTSTCSDGGGGGGGRFGGGGGGSTTSNNRGGGGGGGGSDLVTGASQVETAGSGVNPGNSSDTDRNGAGLGGTGGVNFAGATSGADGAVVITYTTTGTGITSKLSWSKFNSSTKAIESPDPGTGTCSGWCTNSLYNLPTALTNLSLVAYNGFLYAIGGENSGGTPQTSVYIAKLGANGEPSLWHPSGGTPVYWYTDTALSAARSKFAAVAYNNRMYILGGLTTSSTLLSSNTVQSASINPTGTLTTWSTTGMSALSAARYGLTAQVYNDSLYVIGGDATFTGTPITTVEYAKLNSDGTMNSWVATSSLVTSGRMTMGGSFSTIWGAYVYVGGGCTAVNGSGYCTAIASDMQLASINADGSLAPFNTIIGLTNSRIGHTLIAWQGGLYRLGGCRAQDGSTGACTDTIFDVDYGVINQEGEASTVANSVASGTAPCSGASPYGCDLPGVSIIGNVLSGSAILNGYLYIWGGCSNSTSGCGTVSRGTVYTSIGSDGSLTKPASCGSWTNVNSWCYNTTSLPVGGVGAPGVAVFNGYLYSVGGFTAAGAVGQIYYTSPSTADGSIASWSNQSITGIGAENVSYPFSFARANPASAGSTPGNLFILGGCAGPPSGIGCGSYTDGVYKCTLSTAGVPAACSQNPGGTNQQLQIGIVPGDTVAGLGAMAGTVYANYIYLMGGLTPNQTDIKTTRYAKIDNNNNIVAVSGGAWVESSNLTFFGRRRGAGFGYNGYLYVAGGYDGSGGGVLADIEFAKINVSDGSIGVWNVSSVSIDQRWGLSMTVSNSYAYVIGGCILGNAPTCSAGGQTDSIQTFQIYNNDSGAISQYSAGNTLGVDRTGGSSTIMNGYIYYAGGCTVIACGTLTKTTYYASIDAYGTVGSWSSGGALPGSGGVAWGKLVNAGGTLYYVGGQTGSANTTGQATVYYTTSISTGNPTWGTAANGLPAARTQIGAAVWNDRIYVLGGYSTGGAVQTSVYSSPQQSSGGDISSAWSSSSTAFNVARAGASAVAYANNLYILGGNDGTNYLSDVQFSQLSTSTGLAGSWTYSTNMPNALSDGDGFASNGYLYVVGGRSATATCRPVTLFAPISANTTIATGNNPTGVGTWSETNQKYTGDRFGAAASYSGGKVYLIGGGCSAMVGSGDRMYYSTLKSQPQVAKYSIMIDTDTDVFPTGWLMNGLDNSIGAQWKMNYQSMSDNDTVVSPTEDCGTTSSSPAMTTWGTTINYGNVTLGTVAPYVPRNGTVINSGTISQTGTNVTASSSVFTDEIIGGVLTYADGTTANIVSRTSGTIIVVDSSTKSGISGQTYSAAGGNIHCARFYYMLVTIDSSQAFGYPEDVTRGPTIADLSLFFTADPSKRLRHGKTFTGGLQQPLDTPCRVSGANPGGSQPNCPLP